MSKFYRIADGCKILSLSRSTLHRMEAIGLLPKRRRIGQRAVAYDANEIDAWAAERERVTVHCKAAGVTP